ncbi:MAG TPA: BMC domain-containing protein [Polyangia bacterium]|nr:BMC domain-containing protein [Polyangia bacterium]
MGDSLALIEIASIARGHRVADAMVKRAPVALLRCEPVSPGKILVLVDGDVASVDEAFRAGRDVAGEQTLDALFLPQAHPQLPAALRGEARAGDASAVDALGVVETTTVAATILAADAACKAAAVRLIEMQLARGLGGKAYFIVTGPLAEIEAAVEAATAAIAAVVLCATEIIAAPHEDLVGRLR